MLNPASDRIEAKLRERLPEAAFRQMEPRYAEEPRGRWKTPDALLLTPATVEEVAEIVRTASAFQVPVIPYGGGTGLVAGQVAPDGPRPIVLSLERMRAIREVLPKEGVLVAEAGAILADVQAAAEEAGCLFPLSLASGGSAQIGGVLATNAGGVNVLRYGNARELCIGIEAVLPNGSVHHGLKRLRKDNTGYDLRNLLIGAEGTLGVITAAVLRLFPRPVEDCAAVMAVTSPEAALSLLLLARERLGEGISAFELLSGVSWRFLAETMPQIRRPLDYAPDWMVLIDIGLTADQDAAEALTELFSEGLDAGLVTDGAIAQNVGQRAAFWEVREAIPEANRLIGAITSHDISVPLSAISAFINEAGNRIAEMGDFRINCFGHVGDGNLHYNTYPPAGRTRQDYANMQGAISDLVHGIVNDMDGSISAEHGIGRMKVADLERYGDPAKLEAMRSIKQALDPAGIMNPGAILRAS